MDTFSKSVNIREGDRVKARVIRVLSSGAIVKLEGGQRGIIRNRELYWKRSQGDPERVISIGDEISAIVLKIDPDEEWIELSRRQALGDPWEKVKQGGYHVGKIVSGEVVNVMPYGAFVELEPGIDGLLHKSAIPGGRDTEVHELLWIGDQVEVVITDIDVPERRMSLSITERLGKRRDDGHVRAELSGSISSPGRVDKTEARRIRRPRLVNQESVQSTLRVLIVDDDTEFVVSFANWLRRLGYEVATAKAGLEVLTENLHYDLVFLDIGLPDANGIQVAVSIQDRDPDAGIVLITGQAWNEQNSTVPIGLEVVAALPKPLDYDRVLELLASAEKRTLARIPLRDIIKSSKDIGFLEHISIPLHVRQSLGERLEGVLDILREETQAKAVVIFGIDPITLEISMLAASGFDTHDVDKEALQSLRFSVVRNVALDGEKILEETATYSKRFGTLLQFFNFESCVAVPIPAIERDSQYALFLVHTHPHQFTSVHLGQAFAVSQLVAAIIHEDTVHALIRESHKSVLIGQLVSSLVHELRNMLNRIEQQARNLELDCQEFSEKSRTIPPHVWSSQFGGRVKQILNANAELRNLLAQYLGLIGKEELTTVDVNALVSKTAHRTSYIARDNQVRIVVRQDPRLPPTVAIPLRIEQVLLNVALNAIQQMGAQAPRGGLLQISTSYDTRDSVHPLKIRFADEGPGIHRKLWNWIFEMGTSTRVGGTGLGLFVSKGLMESMGGWISVEKSYMFVGSTFLIELPIVPPGEVGYA